MLAPDYATSDIRTRFLIISDTHASPLVPSSLPTSLPADVAIHCGDLTQTSTLTEYEETLSLLKSFVNIPLKLVIAGNHDFSLQHNDDAVNYNAYEFTPKPATTSKNNNNNNDDDDDDVDKEKKGKSVVTRDQMELKQIRELFVSGEARMEHGIHFLDEGRHQFPLMNGAFLEVYASSWTPSPSEGNEKAKQMEKNDGKGKGKEKEKELEN